jgi:hypothetical protein
MSPWVTRGALIILAIAFVPVVVNGTALFVEKVIHAGSEALAGVFGSLSGSSETRVRALLKLSLYFVLITLIVKALLGKQDPK